MSNAFEQTGNTIKNGLLMIAVVSAVGLAVVWGIGGLTGFLLGTGVIVAGGSAALIYGVKQHSTVIKNEVGRLFSNEDEPQQNRAVSIDAPPTRTNFAETEIKRRERTVSTDRSV